MAVQISTQIKDKKAYAALNRLRQFVGGGAAGTEAGLENVFYVSKDGSDGSAQPSSLVHKYLTIQAAVTAASAVPLGFGVVHIGPGIYTEAIVVPDGATNLAIVGEDNVVIAPPDANLAALTVAPTTTPVQRLYVSNLYFIGALDHGNPSGGVVAISGAALPGHNPFAGGYCVFEDVLIQNVSTGPALCLVSSATFRAFDCLFGNASTALDHAGLFISQCSSVTVKTSDISRVVVEYVGAAATVAPGSPAITLQDCDTSSGIRYTGDGQMFVFGGTVETNGVWVDDAVEAVLDDANVGVSGNYGRYTSESVSYQGDLSLSADYATIGAVAPTQYQSYIRGGNIEGDLTVLSLGAVTHAPRFRNVDIIGTITAEDTAYPDIRACKFTQDNLVVVGGGGIDRDIVKFPIGCQIPAAEGPVNMAGEAAPVITNSGGGAFPPYVGSQYTVCVEPAMAGSSVTWVIRNKAFDGFDGSGFIAGAPQQVDAYIVLIRDPTL